MMLNFEKCGLVVRGIKWDLNGIKVQMSDVQRDKVGVVG